MTESLCLCEWMNLKAYNVDSFILTIPIALLNSYHPYRWGKVHMTSAHWVRQMCLALNTWWKPSSPWNWPPSQCLRKACLLSPSSPRYMHSSWLVSPPHQRMTRWPVTSSMPSGKIWGKDAHLQKRGTYSIQHLPWIRALKLFHSFQRMKKWRHTAEWLQRLHPLRYSLLWYK